MACFIIFVGDKVSQASVGHGANCAEESAHFCAIFTCNVELSACIAYVMSLRRRRKNIHCIPVGVCLCIRCIVAVCQQSTFALCSCCVVEFPLYVNVQWFIEAYSAVIVLTFSIFTLSLLCSSSLL